MNLTSTGIYTRELDGRYKTLLVVYAPHGREEDAFIKQQEYAALGIPTDIITHNSRDKAFEKAKKIKATEFLEI